MTEFPSYLQQAWQSTSGWEMLAVLFAIAYLLLAIKESIWCWPAALVSTLIYVFLFFDVNLYMESALQLFYIAMAIFGWVLWRHHQDSRDDLQISAWSVNNHLAAILLITALVLVSGYLLHNNTDAAFPWLDSFTTWGAVITTWMVVKKILENWIYWLIIDSVSIYLFIQRELYLTALLFFVYVMLCFVGYHQWRKNYKQNQLSTVYES